MMMGLRTSLLRFLAGSRLRELARLQGSLQHNLNNFTPDGIREGIRISCRQYGASKPEDMALRHHSTAAQHDTAQTAAP